jgi:CheY-like chemotaxis protein
MSVDDHDSTVIQIWENEGGALAREAGVFPPRLADAVAVLVEGRPDAVPIVRTLSGCSSRPPSAKRVLVVEDAPDNRDSLRGVVAFWGFEVRVAKDGPTALALATGFRPDVTLIDIDLPQMDWHELIRRLKCVAGCDAPVCIALSGWARPVDWDRSLAADRWWHLVRPVNPAVLKAVLDTATADWGRAD